MIDYKAEMESYERMFNSAVCSLAEISQALDIPCEIAECANGNLEMLEAIGNLKDIRDLYNHDFQAVSALLQAFGIDPEQYRNRYGRINFKKAEKLIRESISPMPTPSIPNPKDSALIQAAIEARQRERNDVLKFRQSLNRDK